MMIEQRISAAILYSRANKQQFVVAATLFGALIAGTGGHYSQNNMEWVSEWTSVPAIAISVSPPANLKEKLQKTSIPNAIRQIREKLGLKMSEVAEIFGVSRQAVYLWLEGGNLKQEYIQRTWELSQIADQMQAAGIERPEHFIHRPVSADGLTLYRLLLRRENVETALSLLREQSAVEQRIRVRAAVEPQSTRARRDKESSLIELSTPIWDEHNG